MNVDVAGGDFIFVEMPGPSLLAALSQQKTDAATFILSQTYLATSSGQFRPIAQPARDMYELWGLQMIPSVNVSYPEKLQARPEAFREFNRMIKASVDYLGANPDEVYSAVAREQNIDKAFFPTLFKSYAEYPGVISAQDRKAIAKTWELAQKFKLLNNVPDVDRFIWSGATQRRDGAAHVGADRIDQRRSRPGGRQPSWRSTRSLAICLRARLSWRLDCRARILAILSRAGPARGRPDFVQLVTVPALARNVVASLLHVAAAVAVSFAISVSLALLAHYLPIFRTLVHGRLSPF